MGLEPKGCPTPEACSCLSPIWQPMATEPGDGAFRLYGLHVRNKTGFEGFEVHYVARNDEGEMVEPSTDSFTPWSFEDFEVWADAPQPPTR